jgi:hypothetical protein
MVFDASHFIEEKLGRPVFRPAKDTVLLHLGHPVFRHALGNFARLRFPGRGDGVSATRWAVRRGTIPRNSDALLLLTMEEMAVNALREPFHHWVRTLRILVTGEKLGAVLPWSSPHSDRVVAKSPEREDVEAARKLWEALEYDVRDLLRARTSDLESIIQRALAVGREVAIADAKVMFEGRIQEVRESIRKTTIKSIEKERDELIARRVQGFLFPEMAREYEQKIANLDEELKRRRLHADELLDTLTREQERVTNRLLPLRYSLAGGGVQVFPLSIEIRLPEAR